MDNFLKVVGGGVIIWLLFGGKGMLEKKPKPTFIARNIPADSSVFSPSPPSTELKPLPPIPKDVLPVFRNRPPFEIQSLDYLLALDADPVTYEQIKVTYYLRENSARCHFDSLPPCLQEHVVEKELNKRDFQYTYFFDRVLEAGTGVLTWEMRDYLVRYEALRKYRWTSGKRDFSNKYDCEGFSFRSKKGVEFIQDNLLNHELFLPLEALAAPNGLTASGEPANDWQTLAVNLADFPLSVPNAKLRANWSNRAGASGKRPPRARVFVVLEFANGKKYLTEASDTGNGVKSKSVDWRIGNTAEEIERFHALGARAKATAFIIDDAKVTFMQVWTSSNQWQ